MKKLNKPAWTRSKKTITTQTGHERISKPPRKRRKKPPVTTQRKALLNAYNEAYGQIPSHTRCPRCGLSQPKECFERHHPAGRRKASFLFSVQTCSPCHQWTHANPKDAEQIGLLWPGRNSKVLTFDDARELVLKQPFPALYSLQILENFSLTKP